MTPKKLMRKHDPKKYGEFDNDAYIDMYVMAESLEKERNLFKEELLNAVEIIKIWHSDEAWEIYYNHAPEMKNIREALKL